jgi:hypothetical protein
MCKYKLKKHIFVNMFVIILLVLLSLTLNPFHKTMAFSPSFELQEMTNENHHSHSQ